MAGTRWVVMLHQGMWEGTSVPVAVCHTEAAGAEFVKRAQAWADETRERWHDTLSESDDYDERHRLLKAAFPDRREDGDVPHELFGWLDPTEHADFELVELPSVSAADLHWDGTRAGAMTFEAEGPHNPSEAPNV